MSNMEFLSINSLNTTTQITVSTNSNTSRLFDREYTNQYVSSGDNDDATTTTIRIDFSSYQSVDRIILENHNFKSFKIYYNSVSANLFSLTSAATGTAEWNQNSETNLYLKLEAAVSVNSLFIEVTATMAADEEKKIGQLWITKQIYALDNNPDAKGYKPQLMSKSYDHKMSDGGIARYFISDKFNANVSLKYIDSGEYTSLRNIYDTVSSFVFVPFPTATNWDSDFPNGRIYECNWVKGFDFEQYQSNLTTNGFKGTIRLKETPR